MTFPPDPKMSPCSECSESPKPAKPSRATRQSMLPDEACGDSQKSRVCQATRSQVRTMQGLGFQITWVPSMPLLHSLSAGRLAKLDACQSVANAGYADQAHMTRDVNRLANIRPTVLLRSAESTLQMSDLFKT